MKEFSEGFLHDIADLIDLCVKNDTDNLEIEMPINGKTLKIKICFSIDKEREEV